MIYILLVLCLLCKYNEFCCDFLRDAATNHTAQRSGQRGLVVELAVQEGRSQRDGSAAVRETVNQTHTHKVGLAQTQGHERD